MSGCAAWHVFGSKFCFSGHVAQEELRVKQRAVMKVSFQARSEPLRVVRISSKQISYLCGCAVFASARKGCADLC